MYISDMTATHCVVYIHSMHTRVTRYIVKYNVKCTYEVVDAYTGLKFIGQELKGTRE